MADRGATASPRGLARLGGALYGISAVPAAFSVYVVGHLVVRGDAAATAANVLGSEGLYRAGFVADLVGILFFVAAMVCLFELFRPVHRRIALLMLVFSVIGAAIQALNGLGDATALLLLKSPGVAAALPAPQVEALALVAARLHSLTYSLALVFFAAHTLMMSVLLLRSTFLPRILGALIALDGAGYLVASLGGFLAPPLAARLGPYVPIATATIAEAALMLWLIVRGVDAARWEEQAAAAT